MKLYCIKTDANKAITKSRRYDLIKEETYKSRIDGREIIIYLIRNDNGENIAVGTDNFLPKHLYDRKNKWNLMSK